MAPRLASLAAGLLASTSLLACTTTADSTNTSSDPQGPTVDAITYKLAPLNACPGSTARAEALAPRGENLLLLAATQGDDQPLPAAWLRAPGACGALAPCGHFLVIVDVDQPKPLRLRLATRTLEIPLDQLAQPFGPHKIEVQFHDDDQLQALGADNLPLTRTISVETVAPGGCE